MFDLSGSFANTTCETKETSELTGLPSPTFPQELGTFTNRKSLPEAWCGIRDEELSSLTGIDGCVFVHASGFIGGNKTRKGVMEMAVKALEL